MTDLTTLVARLLLLPESVLSCRHPRLHPAPRSTARAVLFVHVQSDVTINHRQVHLLQLACQMLARLALEIFKWHVVVPDQHSRRKAREDLLAAAQSLDVHRTLHQGDQLGLRPGHVIHLLDQVPQPHIVALNVCLVRANLAICKVREHLHLAGHRLRVVLHVQRVQRRKPVALQVCLTHQLDRIAPSVHHENVEQLLVLRRNTVRNVHRLAFAQASC